MKRLSQGLLAVVAASLVVLPTTAAGQDAPRRLVAPVRGEATVEITKPDTKVVGKEIVTVILVKNTASGPIAGLKVEENWYDKGGNPVGGGVYRHPRPLPVGEVIKVELKTPRRPSMQRNQYQFSHANGAIKPTTVAKLEVTEPPSE